MTRFRYVMKCARCGKERISSIHNSKKANPYDARIVEHKCDPSNLNLRGLMSQIDIDVISEDPSTQPE